MPALSRGQRGDVLLDVRGLRTSFKLRDGTVRAVTGVDFAGPSAARSWAWSANQAAARA